MQFGFAQLLTAYSSNVSSFNSTLKNYGLITSNVIQGVSTTLSTFTYEGNANFSNLLLKNRENKYITNNLFKFCCKSQTDVGVSIWNKIVRNIYFF